MIRGSLVAVPTPFTGANEIDEQAFAELIEWQIQEGSDGLIVCGTAGEAPTLSYEEQKRVIELAVQVARGRVPIVAGTGTNDTRETLFLTEQAQACGANGCMLIVPYYNRPTFGGCLAHYREIARVGLPMVVYHHPKRTGLCFTASQIGQICEIDQVVAVKEASCDLDLIQELINLTPKAVLAGDDTFTMATIAAGGAGVISTVANLIPRAWKQFVTLLQTGNVIQARALFFRFLPLCKSLFLEANPSGVKYGLSLLGKCKPHMRLPLIELQEPTKKKIADTLKSVLDVDHKGHSCPDFLEAR